MKMLLLLITAFPNPNTGNGVGGTGIPPGSVLVTNFGGCRATTDASVDCLAGFNAAIAAMGAAASQPRASDLYVPQPTTSGAYYYLSGPLHITRSLHLIGQGGTGSNQFSSRPKLVWPAGSNGIVVDFPDGATVDGLGAEIDHLSLTSSYASEWLPSHSYTAGSIVIPRDRTGYVYVSGSGTHSSGSSEPTWNTTIGGTTSDGTITWTTTVASAVQMLALASVHDCSISGWSGNGVHIEASVPSSNANDWKVYNNFIQSNAGSALFVSGTDANGGFSLGNTYDSNDAWGLYDTSFLGNFHSGNEISSNGILYAASSSNGGGIWVANTPYSSGLRVLPTVKNGYAYSSSGGTSSGTEPTWPTTIGNTVSDGTITWTCFARYNGGSAFLGPSVGVNTSNAIGNYVEGSEYPVFLGEGAIWISGPNGAGIDVTSTGYWDDGATKPPVSFVHPSSDLTYDVTTIVGDSTSSLSWMQMNLVNKSNALVAQENISLDAGGYIDFVAENYSGYRSIRIPTTLASGGAGSPVVMPNGWEVSAASIIADSATGKIHDVTDPTSAQDAATKHYVDTSAAVAPSIYGYGQDGDLTISSGTTTLTQDMYYHNLTISGTGSLVTTQFRVFVSGTLDISNAPANAIAANGTVGGNSTNASGGIAGTQASSIAGTVGGGQAGGNGGAAGGVGANGVSAGLIFGQGGAGGNSGAGVGAGKLGGTTGTTFVQFKDFFPYIARSTTTAPNAGAGGGGGGGGTASVAGGGAGGGGGHTLYLVANTINRGGSTTAGAIAALGGNGGNGFDATQGGGGGGGGGGGFIYLVYGTLTGSTATNAISAAGGTGGNAGTGGTRAGGDGGNGGNIDIVHFQTGYTIVNGSAGSPQSSGSGGVGGACSSNL